MNNNEHTTSEGRPDYGPRDFEPSRWTSPVKPAPARPSARTAPAAPPSATADEARVGSLVEAIERQKADIASAYDDWIRVGFALASSLGEAGRPYFHRIAALSPKYDAAENDRQYSLCLRGGNGSVTLGTLFHMAKANSVEYANAAGHEKVTLVTGDTGDTCGKNKRNSSGNAPKSGKSVKDIDKSGDNDISDVTSVTLWEERIFFESTFSDKVNPSDWPTLLRPVALYPMGSGAHTDKMLLASLALISGMLPNVCGTYGGQTVYPPLYFIFCGPAASRKGEIGHCQGIVKPLCGEMRGQWEKARREWEEQHSEWLRQGASAASRSERGPEPVEPPFRTPLIPANSTASAAYRQLANNEGWGIMFDTEADTVTQSLTSEYGDYSTALRKAFHHEPISMSRVKDNQFFEVDTPRLTVVLTCTPGQIRKLFPTFENGLGSRFLFYGLNRHLEWINPFAQAAVTPEDLYAALGAKVLSLRHALEALGSKRVRFRFTETQVERFNAMFSAHLVEQFAMLGDGITSFVFRMGLSAFRIAMVLSVLRRAEGELPGVPPFSGDSPEIVCTDTDFRTTLCVMEALVCHTARVYASVAEADEAAANEASDGPGGLDAKVYAALPAQFGTTDVLSLVGTLCANKRHAYRILGRLVSKFGLVRRVVRGRYEKVARVENALTPDSPQAES